MEPSKFLWMASESLSEASECFLTASEFLFTVSEFHVGASAKQHPNAKRIAAPSVRAKILTVIGRKLQPADRDDVMQKVYLRLFAIIDQLPEADDDLLGLVAAVTHMRVIDHFRGDAIRSARDVEQSEADEVPEPASAISAHQQMEWKSMLGVAEAAVAEGKVPAETLPWARRLAQGDTFDDIAADEGLDVKVVEKRMERARKYLRARWLRVSGITGAVIGAIVLFFLLRRPPQPTIGPEVFVPVPSVTEAPAVETTEQKVDRLRREAQAACDAHDYDRCESRLDELRRMNPDIETLPDVITMRKAIRDSHRKPR